LGDIIRDGVILGVYEFIVIISWIVVSSPMSSMIGALTNAGVSMGVTQMTFYQGLVNHVFDICMVLMALIPIIWFVVRMWSREPDWGYRYY